MNPSYNKIKFTVQWLNHPNKLSNISDFHKFLNDSLGLLPNTQQRKCQVSVIHNQKINRVQGNTKFSEKEKKKDF